MHTWSLFGHTQIDPLRFNSGVVITSQRAIHDKFLLCKKCCFRELDELPEGILDSNDLRPPLLPPLLPFPPPEPPQPPPLALPGAEEDDEEEGPGGEVVEEERVRLRLTAGAPLPLPDDVVLLDELPEVEALDEGSVSNGGPGMDGPETDSFEWMWLAIQKVDSWEVVD